jgi:hypothetical protein
MGKHMTCTAALAPLIATLMVSVFSVSAHASVLSDAVAQCTTLNQYCHLAGLDANIPLELVDSHGGHNILEYAAKGVWSDQDKKLLFYGQGHLTDPYAITYVEATNTWLKTSISASGYRHSYSSNAINPSLGRWYYKEYSVCDRIRRFSIGSLSEASVSAVNNFGNNTCYSGIEFFPELGQVIFASLESGANWGVMGFTDSPTSAGTWERFGSPAAYNAGSGDGQLVYNPVHHAVVFGSSTQKMFLVDQSKGVREVATAPCTVNISNPGFPLFTVDPVTGHHLLLCADGATHQFDLSNGVDGSWSQVTATPAPFYGSAGGVQNGYFSNIAIPSATHGGVFFLECGGVSNCRGGQKPRLWFLRHGTGTPVPPDTVAPAEPRALSVF